ncbi:DUF4386 domain-containing protein [Parvularcula sp. ZS-1/3]|uniref:DUF4386 domain-containing protein n=1 Tax=Parvularcula mediterranea TaxID=2732508 RepID=A0A7Y3RNX0_9PROT|nr:DUF4386 domain-containing protein [Parvularcula mediterranea]NNU17523.1 DUF4386 domain-containing protein [Parvularcula mediterranea]
MIQQKPRPRLIGVLYLTLAILAGWSYFAVVTPAAAGLQADISVSTLRLGLLAMVVVQIIDLLIAFLLYQLMLPAGRLLAGGMMGLRLLYVIAHIVPLVGLFSALFPTVELASLQERFAAYDAGFTLSLGIFGLHLIVLGVLIFRSTFLPSLLGLGLIAAGLAYGADTLALTLYADYTVHAATIQLFVGSIAALGEITFLLWILFAGVKTFAWRAQLQDA